jgi:hypothetical protein
MLLFCLINLLKNIDKYLISALNFYNSKILISEVCFLLRGSFEIVWVAFVLLAST